MISFKVVKEPHGWAVRMGERMTTPFWTRDLAIREANCLADSLRCHGECAEVIVEGEEMIEAPEQVRGTTSERLAALLRRRWVGP